MDPPWSVRIEDEAPLALISMVSGEACLVPDEGDPWELRGGDTALVRGPGHYTIADRPDTSPIAVIHPGQRCETPDGATVAESMSLGVRTWGNGERAVTTMLIGAYERHTEVSQRMLASLPPIVVLRSTEWDSPLVGLLADEVVRDEPGQEVVLDRLLDLLVVAAVRTWFARPDSPAPAWYRAHGDPLVGRAVQMLHHNPDLPWTVQRLAAEVGLSRAALARRFTELVGEPPMSFLTNWRLTLAADLLHEPGATVGGVARQVGYGSPFALSAAFKRVHGVSPQHHRAAARAG